tara:strand:- start:4756 stop:5562 length:807 start_codon:yes stop_codon:yes gene_type:complete
MKISNKAKKSLGQNFLIDKNIIRKIVNIPTIHEKKIIMEIGAGYGSLSEEIILLKPKKFIAVEKDKKLALHLETKFQKYINIKIINEDILNIISDKKLGENVIIFGNLPYNISTKILSSLIMLDEWPPWYEELIFMFQKEVADRIIAKPKTKEFSRLTVLSNWRLEIKKHFNVSKNSFSPKPKISSTLLSFKPKKNNLFKFKNPKNLEKVTRILFANRRKMINKNLKKLFGKRISLIKNLNLNQNLRPEELSNEIYYKITKEYEKLSN